MKSINKTLFTQLTRENKKIAVNKIVEKTSRAKLTVQQLWLWGDNIPSEHQNEVENILNNLLNEQETENSRKEAV